MIRARDVIDVRLTDEQEAISPTLALADLRAAIFNATGHDIERGDYYRIVVKRMGGSGNRSAHALVAIPRDAQTPDDIMRRSFISLFGQPSQWMSDDLLAAAQSGQRATFAIPMGGARAA